MSIAIGILDAASGRTDLDRQKIEAVAKESGHELAEIVELTPDIGMPIVHVRDRLHANGATVLITPDVDTVWDDRRGWTELATVVVCQPYEIWRRRKIWPAPVAGISPVIS